MSARSSLRRLARLAATGSSASRELTRYRAFLRQGGHYPGAFFNLTIDFELAWSRARRGDGSTTGEEALERSRRARSNLPALLRLCEEFELPLTFAVVGHVALRECDHRDPPAFAPSWNGGDWYAVNPRQSLDVDGDYYGADLVQAIQESPVGHEVASHGFSHVNLGDDETTTEVARFELDESYRILSRLDPQLSTLVFPKNHLSALGARARCRLHDLPRQPQRRARSGRVWALALPDRRLDLSPWRRRRTTSSARPVTRSVRST